MTIQTYIPHPALLLDSYKLAHPDMFPEGMEDMLSNWTARTSRIEGIDHVVFLGLQSFLIRFLMDTWNEGFFAQDIEDIVAWHDHVTTNLLGKAIATERLRELHALGYLPLEFRALPEGTEVPLRVPMFTVHATHPRFGWLVNQFESLMSAELWIGMTTATQALRLRRMLDAHAMLTSDTPEMVDWQGHDFSFRGMGSVEAAASSGLGHLLSFAGTDSVPSLMLAERAYGANGFIGGSVPASEHSVMCAGGQLTEGDTIDRLVDEYGESGGPFSVVGDTWNLWDFITVHMASRKAKILAMNAKFVVRPDSGNPADILCGDPNAPEGSPARKGVVELLGEVFGYSLNSKGYKVLDPHVGAIYGDSITFDRALDIVTRLKAAGWDTTTVVLGIGSFTYQYVTRDTFGFAMKATWAQVNGESRDLFKDPITDNGVKRSARGRIAVLQDCDGLHLVDQATPEQEAESLLQPVWRDGKFTEGGFQTFAEIAARVGKRNLLPS